MDRIVRGTAATISITLLIDGAATDPSPDSATVEVVRDDGTTLVTETAATNAGTGEFSYTLAPAQTALLDVLTARWTATIGGHEQTLETHAEIVGGHLCTLADIDANLNKAGAAATYSTETKAAARDAATDAFEAEAGVAFTPRYRRATLDGSSDFDLYLPTPRVLSITAGSLNGAALSAGELGELQVEGGSVYREAGWGTGRRSVTLAWEHGHRTPPADVSRAVAVLAASLLKDGPFDDRGYGVTDEGGAVRLLTAGISGAAFSIPDVESALARHRYITVPV